MTQPNYHDEQFHQYYPPEHHSPLSQSPATSVHTTSTHSTGKDTTQTSVTSSTTSSTSTTPSTTAHCSSHAAVSRKAHRTLTLFTFITLVESLNKTNLLLVSDMKGELQTINNQLSNIPINDIRKEQAQAADNLSERMSALEKGFVELRDVIMMRTNQRFKIDPELLEKWDPIMLVIKRSPWTNMRLILNKVASDNIADLFPSDWSPKPLFSKLQKKHFKVLSEVMTNMFHQCGILQDCDVLAI